jgi:hypothetical protein
MEVFRGGARCVVQGDVHHYFLNEFGLILNKFSFLYTQGIKPGPELKILLG